MLGLDVGNWISSPCGRANLHPVNKPKEKEMPTTIRTPIVSKKFL